MAEFRAHRHQITNDRLEYRRGGFNGDVRACLFDGGAELDHLLRQKRLATGNHHMARGKHRDFRENLFQAPILAFRLPGGIRRIAPYASEIAPRSPNEDGWDANQPAFTLYRGKYLRDAHGERLADL